MKIARTAAVAAVELPKIRRNSRSHATWKIRAQQPEAKRSQGIAADRLPSLSGGTGLAIIGLRIETRGRRAPDGRTPPHRRF
ncbi:MAG TPA: hypothetical protein DCQ98_19725 [Planctomycetaceae bacterium]|nr:hypothetical protein [Planctomycetaceae bacterium]